MHKKMLILILILACLSAGSALAQEGTTLQAVKISLWPEYDQPTVLVIYHITLPAGTSLPQALAIRIPAEVDKPNAVAARQADGSLFNLPFEQETNGAWSMITFQATTLEVQLEYYDPGLVKNGNERQYEFEWPGDYAVDALAVEVQQPVGAEDMVISPSLGSGVPADDGMIYYNAEAGALASSQPFSIEFSYTKPTDELSTADLPVQPSAPINANTSGWMTLASRLPWLLGGLGVSLIVGGGIWYWLSGREKARPKKRTRRQAQPERELASEEHIYCHNCGKRAGPGDRFCRTCGTALRGG